MIHEMTLELTDEIYEAVKRAASEKGLQPVEWVVNSLRQNLFDLRPGSPQAILQALREPPHLNPEDVDEMERMIKEGALPINWKSIFEDDEEESHDLSSGHQHLQ
ncbi:MAG TPA: hypothetical protein VE715_10810 [Blastocatellia bacterium]|nr:hypothetical protein [Blastocatellia bacterium]